MNPIFYFLGGCYFLSSLFSFGLMWYDKAQSKRKGWRIPENKLLLASFFGGAPGTLFAIYIWPRHKSRKAHFYLGVPFLLVLQAGLFYFLLT